MRSLLHALVFLIAAFSNSLAADSTIYSHPFGKPSDPAIIFIHGGPGYNAYSFEESTADSLAHRGFFVVDYDQRGSGRSEITRGKFTYDEVVADLESIYDRYHLKKAALIGHSWGGLVATMFTARHPKMVREIILVSAPISLQRTLHTIMSNYGAKFSDTASEEHSEWAMINDLDPSSFQYSSGAFQLAMTGGFYRPKVQSEHAKALWAKLKVDDTAHWASHNSFGPIYGLFKYEHYTLLDLTDTLRTIAKTIPVFGIYGDEDGLYDPTELARIGSTIGSTHMTLVRGASHNVFIDQQPEFLDRVVIDMKKERN